MVQVPNSFQIKKWFNIKNKFSVNTLATCKDAKSSTNGTLLYYERINPKILTPSRVRRVCFVNKCYFSIF